MGGRRGRRVPDDRHTQRYINIDRYVYADIFWWRLTEEGDKKGLKDTHTLITQGETQKSFFGRSVR